MKDSGSIALFIVIAIGFGSLCYYLLVGRENKRTRALKELALMRGFEFNEYDRSGLIKEKIGFVKHSSCVFVYNVMSRKDKGVMFYLFDAGSRASSQRTTQESICLIEADDFNFDGHIQVMERDNVAVYECFHWDRALIEVVTEGDGLFNQRYAVCSNNSEQALKIINPAVQTYLLGHNKGWRFSCELFGNRVMVRTSRLKEVEDLHYLLDFTRGLISSFPPARIRIQESE